MHTVLVLALLLNTYFLVTEQGRGFINRGGIMGKYTVDGVNVWTTRSKEHAGIAKIMHSYNKTWTHFKGAGSREPLSS